MSAVVKVLLILFLCLQGKSLLFAEETDQFTLPPVALFDMGPGTSQRAYALLEAIVLQTNTEIRGLIPKAKTSKHAARQLALRLNDGYLADLFYKKTGPGYPRWLRGIPKQSKPIQYREILPWKTVYWLVFSQSPLSLIGLTPTINMYGHYFGTDKLGHFFTQGYNYYLIYNYYLEKDKSSDKAVAAAVAFGTFTEKTYLGTLVNGIYANADLYANYAGWKFYTNFAHPITVGNTRLAPLLKLQNNQWVVSKQIDKNNLLAPFISDSFSEALNPSRYAFSRSQIRRNVLKRCADWIQGKEITPQFVIAQLQEAKTWHGEHYGHWLPKQNAITLSLCFENLSSAR